MEVVVKTFETKHGPVTVSGSQSSHDKIRDKFLKACRENDAKEMSILLHLGAPVDICSQNFRTPLHNAVENGQLEIVKILLKYNANVNATDIKDFTPLQIASDGSNTILSNIDRTRTSFFEHRTNSNMFIC